MYVSYVPEYSEPKTFLSKKKSWIFPKFLKQKNCSPEKFQKSDEIYFKKF